MSLIGHGWFRSSTFAFLLLQAGGDRADMGHLRYERSLLMKTAGPACAVLDAAVFVHASESLKDLRVFRDGLELPYALAVNEASQVESEAAVVSHLRESKGRAEFDLAMPGRSYTQLNLRLEGRDYIAEATLTGSDGPSDKGRALLGKFAVFDLSSRGLSRNTTIFLQETSLRHLHVKLTGEGFRVRGVDVLPNREGETLFTAVAETRAVTQRGTETVAFFRVPARVPVERVSVTLDPGFAGNFSRTVRVTARAVTPGSAGEQVTGTILRVRQGPIRMEREALPASLGANLQADAQVEVAVENEGKPPLPVASVVLSMRQRTICFDAPGPVDLLYGDRMLEASRSHYEPSGQWNEALLGPEHLNPAFRERNEPQGGDARRRKLFWAGMLGLMLLCLGLGTRARKRAIRMG